jgi:diguanylate cyclase (GGDEF)-like protein/PAS domain S-box-containing protein
LTESIRVGLLSPLTGIAAIYGAEITLAARIACDEINERGGVLGHPLELIVENDGSLPITAVPAALRLVDEHHCAAIVGSLLSNSRIAVAEQVAKARAIPYLNFSFYEGSIADRYFFHFAALPNQQIDKMIPYMVNHYGRKFFFAGHNYEWPRGSIDAAKRSLKLVNGDVVGEVYLDMGVTPAQIDDLLQQVARSAADVFVPYFACTEQIAVLTRFTEMGLKERMAVAMGHFDEIMARLMPARIREGFYSSNTYFMSVDTVENRCLLELLSRQPGIEGIWPQGNGVLTNFGEGAYLCVHAFAKAAEAAGSIYSERLVDALETVRLQGPQGEVLMDAATHHASVNSYLTRCSQNGSFAIVEQFGLQPPLIPERYREQMQMARLHERSAADNPGVQYATKRQIRFNQRQIAQQMLLATAVAILATDKEGRIVATNPGAARLFGYQEDEMFGMSVHHLLPPHLRLRHAELIKQFVCSEESELRMAANREITGYRKDGSFFPMEASIARFRNDNDWLLVATIHDISERKHQEESFLRQATHDPLTGLPNRHLLTERLSNALTHSQREGLSVALLLVALDGFKLVNDSFGREAGDAVLQAVANRLMDQVRPGDTVARLVGDEFVVVCEQIRQPLDIAQLAERLNETLRQPIHIADVRLFVSASIGIAIGYGATFSGTDLLRQADTAMHAVKEKRRDGWHFFTDNLETKARQRHAIINGLRFAIERNELSPRFQPIVAADSGLIVGAELLLRWHPEEGEVSPAIFIPIAEMSDTIQKIGAWVFREGCRAEAEWRDRWGTSAPYLSLNLSSRQLDEIHLADTFAAILQETGADPTRILLEVTETSLMADIEVNLRVLNQLAELGMRVAVDDFGTGYSSLAQLIRVPAKLLKIDKALIDGIEEKVENRALILGVIGLGRALNLKMLAEGVENAAQLQVLIDHGCDLIQGYYFYRPLVKDGFIDAVDSQSTLTNQGELPS